MHFLNALKRRKNGGNDKMKKSKQALLLATSVLAFCLTGCNKASKSLQKYYDAGITVKYNADATFHYEIIDYSNEVATITFDKCKYYDAEKKQIAEYHFKDQETFKMYYETVFASEPRDFWALYVFALN